MELAAAAVYLMKYCIHHSVSSSAKFRRMENAKFFTAGSFTTTGIAIRTQRLVCISDIDYTVPSVQKRNEIGSALSKGDTFHVAHHTLLIHWTNIVHNHEKGFMHIWNPNDFAFCKTQSFVVSIFNLAELMAFYRIFTEPRRALIVTATPVTFLVTDTSTHLYRRPQFIFEILRKLCT